MRKQLGFAIAAAGAITMAMPMFGATDVAAQRFGVEVGPGGVYVGPTHRPHCRTVTITERRHGVRVTRTERRCDGWRDWD
jgi:hypothetical protein